MVLYLKTKRFAPPVCFFENHSSHLMTLLGSTPQLAAMITLGSACTILEHSSLAAKPVNLPRYFRPGRLLKLWGYCQGKCHFNLLPHPVFSTRLLYLNFLPPNTTECTAPKRTVASIAIIASGIRGMYMRTLSPFVTPRAASAPAK